VVSWVVKKEDSSVSVVVVVISWLALKIVEVEKAVESVVCPLESVVPWLASTRVLDVVVKVIVVVGLIEFGSKTVSVVVYCSNVNLVSMLINCVVIPLCDDNSVVCVVPTSFVIPKLEKVVEPDCCVVPEDKAFTKGPTKAPEVVLKLENDEELENDSVLVNGATAISPQIIMALIAI
jgi:hypothetical protein